MLSKWVRRIVRDELEAVRRERVEKVVVSGLPTLDELRKRAEDSIETRIVALRAQKMTWRAIGAELGISKSEAHRKYSKLTGSQKEVS